MSLPVTAGAAALTLATAGPAHRAGRRRAARGGVPAAAVAGHAAARLRTRRGGGGLVPFAAYRLALAAAVAVRRARRRDTA